MRYIRPARVCIRHGYFRSASRDGERDDVGGARTGAVQSVSGLAGVLYTPAGPNHT